MRKFAEFAASFVSPLEVGQRGVVNPSQFHHDCTQQRGRETGSLFLFCALIWLAGQLNMITQIFESSEAVKVISTFDDLGLKEDLLRGIYAYSSSFIPTYLRSKA